MIISLLCLIVCEMESVNCESETLRKFDEKREVFWQPGHGPARPGEIGCAHRAARHGKTARGPCLGPEARHGTCNIPDVKKIIKKVIMSSLCIIITHQLMSAFHVYIIVCKCYFMECFIYYLK